MTLVLRNVRPWGGDPADVTLDGGAITAVVPAAQPGAAAPDGDTELGAGVVDGRGRILLPSFSDVHVHLDSTRLGLPFRPHSGSPGVWNMMLNDRNNWRDAEASITERATHTLGAMIKRGTTRVRSYAQVDADAGLERFEAVLAARETHRSRADVAVIAFPQAGLLREAGSTEVLEEALKLGADVVGGIDPCALDRDPVKHLDIVFGLAEEYRKPVDIHLHEPGQLGLFSIELILERTRALGMQGLVTVSHAFALADLPDGKLDGLLAEMAELDVSVATVAPATPLPLERVTAAGIRVGLGEDGQRDYWSPYGNADMLDRTWQLAFTNRFRADELIEHCVAVATIGGASVIDPAATRLSSTADRPGLAVGEPAELVLVEGDTVAAAVMDRLPGRTVIHRGNVVADGLQLV
ncbi:N-isopropylammelide isopropylaminohydrolase [Pseudarthrobacter chlorophenolicus A6]|uniref:N-isopropylammelide isopropylaminohydrolase n=1 Tax=Pseudarthrobacter chlorophenolicus (strain ATCC 700700 / DSM 12829 / CIP 107037 / JCM 12360 / KCTC 9906 / NCIMB 13794 / A6) TaxID=452863 RepID=B8HE20_PSECP|nr:amidohydrolase family protein [Pseudarthrobacter chlorophenolicus]ACL39055.1 N-isopropylammelide isopropylaminohydrolase [Pseudarthrobacter chlorophenolicus A6]SDR05005.1 Cytosine/adenosine deaminase [Pseudarthrobacter chlorophenolicus]